jgi:putative heme-binding domain-containing protein
LENASTDKVSASMIALLYRFPAASVQVAAIRSLSRLNAPGLEEVLVARWRTVSPEARREILPWLLSKKERINRLLDAVENGNVMAAEMDAASRSNLRRHSDSEIRGRATALWGDEKLGAGNEIIKRYRESLNLKGEVSAGQATFERLCGSCHRLSGVGNELGPNLALSSTRSAEELLTHIIDPNRDVDPRYVQYNIVTTEGETNSGMIVADNSASITLKAANLQKTISRQQIKSISGAGVSLMPNGLEQGLSLQNMADLLSFLIDSQYDFGTSGQSFSRDVPERK